MNVRTRFAPSPTGHVHIGNIRTAIYNWLFARHHHGRFLLRMEDTDRQRSTPEAMQALRNAMAWLQIDADEEPLYQSARMEAHLAAAEMLLKKGLACKRNKGDAAGECVVFKMPGTDISFKDGIKGTLSKAAENMQDFVIIRSNGTPVFHLANVLDDIEQAVTHVIRGDDHIENTYRHIALYRALGADIPQFAHLPMIVNAQGKPYSKRDGDAFVDDFRAKGFLAETLFNYLVLLGWSPGDGREIMTRDEMIAAFEMERCQSSSARVDLRKLEWMNHEYLLKVSDNEFEGEAFKALADAGMEVDVNKVHQLIPLIRRRVKTYAEIVPMFGYLFSEGYEYDEKAVREKLRREGTAETLGALKGMLATIEPFNAETIEKALRALSEQSGIGLGSIMPPLRIAVSGMQGGPCLYPVLAELGRERVLQRLDKTVDRFLS